MINNKRFFAAFLLIAIFISAILPCLARSYGSRSSYSSRSYSGSSFKSTRSYLNNYASKKRSYNSYKPTRSYSNNYKAKTTTTTKKASVVNKSKKTVTRPIKKTVVNKTVVNKTVINRGSNDYYYHNPAGDIIMTAAMLNLMHGSQHHNNHRYNESAPPTITDYCLSSPKDLACQPHIIKMIKNNPRKLDNIISCKRLDGDLEVKSCIDNVYQSSIAKNDNNKNSGNEVFVFFILGLVGVLIMIGIVRAID